MTYFYGTLVIAGWILCGWAKWSLPASTVDFPVPIQVLTRQGPYRWLRHPMYTGTVMLLTGMGGLGGGGWNAAAFFILSELVTREWAWRER